MTEPQLKLNMVETIVFLGDSITANGMLRDGYVKLVEQALFKAMPGSDIRLIGAGVSGDRVQDCVRRLSKDVLAVNPTIVVILIGVNDVWGWEAQSGTSLKDYSKGIEELVCCIQNHNTKVLLCTPGIVGEKTDGTGLFDNVLDEYSMICRRIARGAGAELLDLRGSFLDYLKINKTTKSDSGALTLDTVHLNGCGNRLLARLIMEKFGLG